MKKETIVEWLSQKRFSFYRNKNLILKQFFFALEYKNWLKSLSSEMNIFIYEFYKEEKKD